ncbi:hypothetical protein PMI42_02325 [Bradyrhizobium sp. YR681]|nr:hypothetical protein PMI42_02325 [Bradyrhizobium sp. YR681]
MRGNKPNSTLKYSKYYFRFFMKVPPGGGFHGQVTRNHTSNRWFR